MSGSIGKVADQCQQVCDNFFDLTAAGELIMTATLADFLKRAVPAQR